MNATPKKINKLSKYVIITEDDLAVIEKEIYTTIAAVSAKSEYGEDDKLALRASLRALKKIAEICKKKRK